MDSSSSTPDKIRLSVSNHQAHVWNVPDIARLRSEHRICGLLGGTLPHLAQQNVFLGVPLILMPEEVVLLVQNEVAVLVDDANAHDTPGPEEKQLWEDQRATMIQKQLVQKAKAKEDEGISPNNKSTSEAAIRKRQERELKKAAAAAAQKAKQESGDADLSVFNTEATSSGDPAVESGRETPSSKGPSQPYAITIPTSSNSVSWYHSDAHAFSTLDAARESGIWLYPSNEEERARCGVFRALWEKDYYLGNGIKFGGEYLVYPGDPLRYHSHFVATVHISPENPLRPMEIVAHGRLGTATKKAHLICTWDDKTSSVDILSIEWSGFG
ncbi:hypothetical protein SCHPADRAFT_101584 [Schizopora paradoxa]|uniref:tRNA-splicing endonuclease subunit Sen34 n=1 Tax=Schizopora paradoxa TaxID=27342 RepID=A0A0H2SNY9_9AGAM|nr:hypothetical protein SCHPADRAFT_101584 [Schizopora paradoxa]